MSYNHVKCPNFVTKDALGALKSLQCKLCGVVIADTIERPKGYERTASGQLVKVVQRQFTRFANYYEIKIAFTHSNSGKPANYFHVTNGCSSCLSMIMSPEVLAELHAADQEESPDGYTASERLMIASHVVALSADQGGIV